MSKDGIKLNNHISIRGAYPDEIASGLRVGVTSTWGREPANRSLNCVASINRYTVPIGVLYAKKIMSKKQFHQGSLLLRFPD